MISAGACFLLVLPCELQITPLTADPYLPSQGTDPAKSKLGEGEVEEGPKSDCRAGFWPRPLYVPDCAGKA